MSKERSSVLLEGLMLIEAGANAATDRIVRDHGRDHELPGGERDCVTSLKA
jgi:hypothetical protein